MRTFARLCPGCLDIFACFVKTEETQEERSCDTCVHKEKPSCTKRHTNLIMTNSICHYCYHGRNIRIIPKDVPVALPEVLMVDRGEE